MTETFYYCYAEGQAPHYATRSEAEYTIEFLRDQDETYAGLTLEDIYREVEIEDIDLDDPCLRNGSTRADTLAAILRERLLAELEGEQRAWFEEYLALGASTIDLNAVMTGGEVAAEFGVDGSTVRRAAIYDWIDARKADERTWLVRRADAERRWGKRAAAR